MRLVPPATLEFIAEPLRHIHAELKLLRLRKILEQTGIIGRGLRRNRPGNRDKFFAQVGKDTADIGSLHAVIARFNQRVSDVFITRKEVGGLPTIVQRFLQVRTHARKVVCRTRLRPNLVGFGSVIRYLCCEFQRDFYRAFILAPSDAQQTRLIGIVRETLFIRP